MNNLELKKELGYCIIAGLLSLLGTYVVLDLFNIDWRVPFSYEGDAFGALTTAQNFITGNGRFLYSNMGAPGVVNVANLPDITNTSYFGMWLLSLVIKEAGLLVNVFYVMTFVVISISMTVSLRMLKLSGTTSVLGGVVYTFLPYHLFRGEQHLFLATYAIVPLACVVVIWIIEGDLYFNTGVVKDSKKNSICKWINWKLVVALCISVLIGMDNVYYIFFSCLLIAFATLWNLIEEKNIKKVYAPFLVILTIGITVIINLVPYFLTRMNGVESAMAGTRAVRDVEYYSLKFSQLILPVKGHRVSILAKIRELYDNTISISFNENYASSLGGLLSIGLIASLIIALKKSSQKTKSESIMKHSGVMNIFMLVLGSVGGISSLIAYFISDVRCYNRLSIFIAFFSFLVVGLFLDKKLKNNINWILVVLIGSVAVADMTIVQNKVIYSQRENEYYVNKRFIEEIEEITPPNSMVFQLPFVSSNHHGTVENMGIYEQFYPFIHSDNLKWSYRATQGSSVEKWQKQVAGKPVKEMLKHLAAVGFKGIYIDKWGYQQEESEVLVNELINITGVKPIISENGRMLYFCLTEYMDNILNQFNEKELEIYSDFEKSYNIIDDFEQELSVTNSFEDTLIRGWSAFESWGVWSDGNHAEINFDVLNNQKDLALEIKFDVYPNPINFDVSTNDIMIGSYTFEGGGDRNITIPISKELLMEENGVYNINVEFDIKNPKAPGNGDSRQLGIGIKEYTIVELDNPIN